MSTFFKMIYPISLALLCLVLSGCGEFLRTSEENKSSPPTATTPAAQQAACRVSVVPAEGSFTAIPDEPQCCENPAQSHCKPAETNPDPSDPACECGFEDRNGNQRCDSGEQFACDPCKFRWSDGSAMYPVSSDGADNCGCAVVADSCTTCGLCCSILGCHSLVNTPDAVANCVKFGGIPVQCPCGTTCIGDHENCHCSTNC